MTVIQECLRGTFSTSAASQNFTFNHSVAAGKIAFFCANIPSSIHTTTFTVTDTKSNTWAVKVNTAHTTDVNSQLVMATCKLTTAVTTSDHITVTSSDRSPTFWSLVGAYGDDPTSVDTISASNITTSTTALSTGSTPTSSQGVQLIVAGFAYAGDLTNTFTLGGTGYTALTGETSTGTARTIYLATKSVTGSPAVRGETATLNTSTAAVSGIMALNIGVTTNRYWKNAAGTWVPMQLSLIT